jgi:hypothetical protein
MKPFLFWAIAFKVQNWDFRQKITIFDLDSPENLTGEDFCSCFLIENKKRDNIQLFD